MARRDSLMTSRRILDRLGRSASPLAPDIARGMRAALATLVPFYFARKLGHHELALTAFGGWLGTLADPGGTRSTRAKTLLTFAIAAAAAVAIGEAVSPSAILGTLVLAAGAFATSLLRAIGAAAASIGTLLVIALAVSVGTAKPAPIPDALAFAAGAGMAVILSSVVWPVWTHLPSRVALAACFRALAGYLRAIERAVVDEAEPRSAEWTEIARTHQRSVRTAIEDARAVAMESRARRSGESNLGSNLRALLGAAEAELALLIALAEELESRPPEKRRAASAHLLATLANHYSWMGDALARTVVRAVPPPSGPDPALAEELGGVARRLLEATAATVKVAAAPASASAQWSTETSASGVAEVRDELRALRDALSLRSTFFRHAARVAIAVTAAQIIGRLISPSHSAWVTVTTIAVLQPYSGATLKRAIERSFGTVLGSVVAVVIAMTLTSPLVLTAALVPLSIAAVVTKPRSYRLFTFFLTPIFVILASRWQGDWWTAAARAADAIAGGVIAVVAALVFPSREHKRLVVAERAVIDTLDHYATVVIETRLRRGGTAPEVIDARREVGIALGTAETSLERLLAEPLRSVRRAEDSVLLVTYARRLAAALTALDAQHDRAIDEPSARAVLAYAHAALKRARSRGKTALLEPPTLEASPSQEALARVLRQAELLGDRPLARHSKPPP